MSQAAPIARSSRPTILRDLAVLGVAVVLGMTAKGTPHLAAAAVLTAGLPVLAYAFVGYLPGRSVAVGCLVLGLGGAILAASGASRMAWADLALLSGLALTCCVVGQRLDQAARDGARETASGRWMHIVVEIDGPNDTIGRTVRPVVSPRRDPERRSLVRLAGERRRGRRPVDFFVS